MPSIGIREGGEGGERKEKKEKERERREVVKRSSAMKRIDR